MEELEGYGKQTLHSYKACKRHILHVPGRGSSLKRGWVRPTCSSWTASQRRQGAARLPLGTQMLAEPSLRAGFTTITPALAHTTLEPSLSHIGTGSLPAHQRARRSPRHTWTCRQHLREPAPPTSSSPILLRHQPITQKAVALQWDHSHLRRQSLAQRGQRSASPQVQPQGCPCIEGHGGPHKGDTRVCRSGDQRECGPGPPEVYHMRPLLQDQKVRLTYLTQRQTQGIRNMRSQRNMSQQDNI